VTRVIKEVQDAHLEELGTKADLKSEIAEAKGEIIKWVAVMLVAQVGAIAALVKLL
jgi:UDP-N-acetylmuramyl pentapeptide synthase